MGIKSLASNKKKSFKSSKTQKWRRQKRAEKKKQDIPKDLVVEDVHLYSNEKLKNKLRNPRNNIEISGKKKRRLTKRLRHSLREKSQMEVEVIDRQPKGKKKALNEDTEMVETAPETETTTAAEASTSAEATSSSSPPTTTTGKKRKNRKKNKKKAEKASTGDTMFEENDGWEDVEMAE